MGALIEQKNGVAERNMKLLFHIVGDVVLLGLYISFMSTIKCS